ncbi:MAG TPA: SMC-Scp complex subunit ScpB [Polyangiaceae bacterium]|jgi:segregation and condensation protein B
MATDESWISLEAHGAPSDEAKAEAPSVEQTLAYLKGLLEAILFVSDRPLELKELARAARLDRKRTSELLEELRADYAGRGLRIEEVGGGVVFRTNAIYAGSVRNFLAQRPVRLSRAQLETLAIVAYRQPITRPEVDDIRGVDSGPVLKGLLERELVRILGKKDEPGRPMLYGTTPTFLEFFGLQSLEQLPTLREFTELTDESRRTFERTTGEEAPEQPPEHPTPSEEGRPDSAPEAQETFGRASSAGSEDPPGVSADGDGEEEEDEDDYEEDDDDEDDDDDDDEEE